MSKEAIALCFIVPLIIFMLIIALPTLIIWFVGDVLCKIFWGSLEKMNYICDWTKHD